MLRPKKPKNNGQVEVLVKSGGDGESESAGGVDSEVDGDERCVGSDMENIVIASCGKHGGGTVIQLLQRQQPSMGKNCWISQPGSLSSPTVTLMLALIRS